MGKMGQTTTFLWVTTSFLWVKWGFCDKKSTAVFFICCIFYNFAAQFTIKHKKNGE